MAESRREKKIPATFHFFALAALPMLQSPVPRLGGDAGPWLQAMPAPWFRGDAGPWFRGDAGPWLRAMPALWFRAFILTASKSRINDETPLNSCTLQGRSSLFRDIAVLG